MFKDLKRFKKIIVTGPQRSGTRIRAKVIAHDTGFKFIGEEEFGITNLGWFKAHLATQTNIVLQCPAFCRYAVDFSAMDTMIVLMRRKVEDIIESQQKIEWGTDRADGSPLEELRRYDKDTGTISQIKYDYWDKFQKHQIVNAMEIEYESLCRHKLWIPKEKRDELMKIFLKEGKHDIP